jgi:hypothetical protein
MSVTKLLPLILVLGLSGCSSNPNYDKAAGCGNLTPVCLAVVAVEDAITKDKNSSQKCSDMAGEKRKSCEAQVKSLNKHIDDASKK